jgi:hypothetical protein
MANTARSRYRLLAALLVFGPMGHAEGQTLPAELGGSYHLLPDRSDDVASVVEQSTSGRSWPVRAPMRDRLGGDPIMCTPCYGRTGGGAGR